MQNDSTGWASLRGGHKEDCLQLLDNVTCLGYYYFNLLESSDPLSKKDRREIIDVAAE